MMHITYTSNESTHIDKIRQKARRHSLGRLIERQPHQLPQFLRRPSEQNLDCLFHAPHRKQTLLHVLLLHTHSGAADHHPLHRAGKLRRQAVGHEPAVAQPDDPDPGADPKGFHSGHHAPGLKGLGPLGPGRPGVAEEEEVRDVDVESGGEGRDDVVPLPHGVGADAVDEEGGGPVGAVGFGGPAVDDGAVAEVGGGGPEAGGGEGATVAGVPGGCEAEASRHYLLNLFGFLIRYYHFPILAENIDFGNLGFWVAGKDEGRRNEKEK
ncbi:hypothetical protein STAS_26876 [Striga asiatica]|uniref:Uncharacterized protein n=1 Tax=Striga asiatica TaxID=4170 RepID=A0A5A7QWC4_STRAF|nr:hypothetical protein STAS_26876 [Striga asiatica]